MKQHVTMPQLGLTMTEGLVAEWQVGVDQHFQQGQVVYVVETDKTANEVVAEQDGILLEILHPVGATVSVGEVLAHWDDGLAASAAASAPDPAMVAVQSPNAQATASRLFATPLARRMAARDSVDLERLHGSGPRGRIKAVDVVQALALTRQQQSSPAAAPTTDHGHHTRIEPTSMQRTVATRLTSAKQDVPHFYLTLEADVMKLMTLRAELNTASAQRVTLNDFVVAALGRALDDMPQVNRVWADDAMLQFEHSDVGIAVHTDDGLYVPVVRQAGQQSLRELARQTQALVARARAKSLGALEMSGGAVTVSNAGMFNVTYITPIINPGQAMILGVGSIRDVFRPDAARMPVLRSELGLVLACDHRVLDGATGSKFLNRVVDLLQHPLELVAGV